MKQLSIIVFSPHALPECTQFTATCSCLFVCQLSITQRITHVCYGVYNCLIIQSNIVLLFHFALHYPTHSVLSFVSYSLCSEILGSNLSHKSKTLSYSLSVNKQMSNRQLSSVCLYEAIHIVQYPLTQQDVYQPKIAYCPGTVLQCSRIHSPCLSVCDVLT